MDFCSTLTHCGEPYWMYWMNGRNEPLDMTPAFDVPDMGADILLEIREKEQTPWDLLPLAPNSLCEPAAPLRMLLHSAIFEACTCQGEDIYKAFSLQGYKAADPVDVKTLGVASSSCRAGSLYAPLPAQEEAWREASLAPHLSPAAKGADLDPSSSSLLRRPAGPYKHMAWTVEHGEMEAAREMLHWIYSRKLSPTAAASPQLLPAVYRLSRQYKLYGCDDCCVKAAAELPGLSAADKEMFDQKRAQDLSYALKYASYGGGSFDWCLIPLDFHRSPRDTVVVLRTLPSSSAGPGNGKRRLQDPCMCSRLGLHAVVLMTGSPYFKQRLNALAARDSDSQLAAEEQEAAGADGCLLGRLLAWTCGRLCGGKEPPLRRLLLVEFIEEGELELAQAVLGSLYGWKALPTSISSSPLKLLRTFPLASRFQVARCRALCLAALQQLPLEVWDPESLAELLQLPEGYLQDAPQEVLALQARARDGIAARYADLAAVQQAAPNRQLYLQFLGLPFTAVAAVLSQAACSSRADAQRRSDLASAWLQGEQGRRCSTEQRSALGAYRTG